MNLTGVSSSGRKVVLVADDFGISPLVTRGILETCQHGLVRCVSIMTHGESCLRGYLRDLPHTVDRGLHINLTYGHPRTDPKFIPSLVDSEGNFYSALIIYAKAICRMIDEEEVYREILAQYEVLEKEGVNVVHLDGHGHVHMLPIICRAACRLAREKKIPFVRSLTKNRFSLPEGPFFRSLFLGSFLGGRADYWASRGFRTLGNFFGYTLNGCGDVLQEWKKLIHQLPLGCSEIMVHPGYDDADLADKYKIGRDNERCYLCSPELKNLVREAGLQITSFSETLT